MGVNGLLHLRSELNTKLNPGQVRLRPARQRRRSSEQDMKSYGIVPNMYCIMDRSACTLSLRSSCACTGTSRAALLLRNLTQHDGRNA